MGERNTVIASVQVDLGKAPMQPFEDAEVVTHHGAGLATLERLADGLYLDGCKVLLWQVEQQQDARIRRDDLRKQFVGNTTLNANVLDALFDHPQLIPQDWKKDRESIFFWGTIYRNTAFHGLPRAAGGGDCDMVRSLKFEVTRHNRKHSSSRFLREWGSTEMDRCFAAVLEE